MIQVSLGRAMISSIMSPPESILQFKFYSSREFSAGRQLLWRHGSGRLDSNMETTKIFWKVPILPNSATIKTLSFKAGNTDVSCSILNDINFLRAIFMVTDKFVLTLGREMRVITLLLDAYSKVRSSFKLLWALWLKWQSWKKWSFFVMILLLVTTENQQMAP